MDTLFAFLVCPGCGLTGTAKLAVGGGGLFNPGPVCIDHLPAGFKVVDRDSELASIDLFCAACDVSAITKNNKPPGRQPQKKTRPKPG